MKVIGVDTDTGFKPIKIQFTLETKEELVSLWHRLNMARNDVAVSAKRFNGTSKEYDECEVGSSYRLWSYLDKQVKRWVE